MERKNIQESLKELAEKIKKNHLTAIIVTAVAGIALLLFSGSFASEKPNQADKTVPSAAERIESKEIEKMLMHIPGVLKAYVLISYEDDGKMEYAYDYKGDLSKKEENVQENADNKMVITRQNGNEQPVLIRQISPGIKGVTVIAQGTEETALKYKIYNAVKSALGVDAHKIEVILN